jgi:hypothetical protein
MTDHPLHSRLRALAEALDAERPAPELRRRIVDPADPRETTGASPRWIPIVAFVAGVLVTWFVLAMRPNPPPESLPKVAIENGARSADTAEPERRCAPMIGVDVVAVDAGCRLDVPELGVVIDVWEPARLARSGRTIAMPEGAATFEVATVGTESPIEVDVGPGRVRVLGTRFEIQNVGDVGHLDLIRGRVAFVSGDEDPRQVAPGERVSWSRVAALPRAIDPQEDDAVETEAEPIGETARSREASANERGAGDPAPSVAPDPSAPDLDDVLERVARLRHAGEYAEARELLGAAMKLTESAHAREVLSFEIGTLLDLEHDPTQACDHWRAHIERFAGGRTIERAHAHADRLECEPH